MAYNGKVMPATPKLKDSLKQAAKLLQEYSSSELKRKKYWKKFLTPESTVIVPAKYVEENKKVEADFIKKQQEAKKLATYLNQIASTIEKL